MHRKLHLPKFTILLFSSFFFLLLAAILLGVLTIHYSLFTKPVKAQVPPPYVSCDEVRPDLLHPGTEEFHSLRPYQASPCNQEPTETARFCGNRLVLSDTVTAIQLDAPLFANNCTAIGGNKFRCSYSVHQTSNYKIDLSEANFPIMGNTEDVVNSQIKDDTLNDAEKTNQYVSWYLNGVIGRAEYQPLSDNEEDTRKLVDFSGPIKKLLPSDVQNDLRANTVKKAVATKNGVADYRHNQVVGCVYGVKILGLPVEPGGIPAPCNEGGLGGVLPRVSHRLADWNNHFPPKASDFGDFQDYWKAYQEWRGKTCFQFEIPFWGKKVLLCGENPAKLNYYSNLYSYIPFSSTEDRVGEVSVDSKSVTPISEELDISNVNLVTTPAELFFSHTEEVADLASILQLTFVPGGNPTTGGASFVSPAEACDLTNVRTNKGDNLFAGSITGKLDYDAQFSCEYDATEISPSCSKDVSIGLGVVTQTPKADEAWQRLVAGPSGIFKRIFPKVGEGGAILGILDMPGSTNVTYSGSGLVSAGNPGARAGENAELYFPHVGGISEYFLKGIQTILRPKGYGEQILSGAPGTFPSSGDIDCDQSAPEVSLGGALDKESTFQLALNWVGGQTGNHVLECYNDAVGKALSAGVNPGLTLWLWLHESNASNYNISEEDFGVHTNAPSGFTGQINAFFDRAKSPVYSASSSLCQGTGVRNDLQAWALIYKSGNCDPNGGGKAFYDDLLKSWSYENPGCGLPKSPTDMSCPK
jgi:hypothetical protein